MNLDNNNIKIFPDLSNLFDLKTIYISNNNIINFEIDFLPTSVQYIDLSRNLLTSVPIIENIKHLDLSFNKIENIQEGIKSMNSISYLGLNGNLIKTLPKTIGDMITLTGINLSNNKLVEIPSEFGNLVNLQGLYLSNNELLEIPNTLGSITALRFLSLDNNRLTIIPKEIGTIEKLKKVDLSNNYLTKLEFSDKANVLADGNFIENMEGQLRLENISNKKIDLKIGEEINLLDYIEVKGMDRELPVEVMEIEDISNKEFFKIGSNSTSIVGEKKGNGKVIIKIRNSVGENSSKTLGVRIKSK